MNVKQFLITPFPIIENLGNKFKVAFAFGLFVFLFMYLFKPFGIGSFSSEQVLFYTLGFGGVTLVTMLVNFLVLNKLFPSFFKEETWTVGREIFITFIHIALIGLSNYFFATWLSITKATFSGLIYIEFISVCLAIFPVIVWTLLRENLLLKRNMKEAERFKQFLSFEKAEIGNYDNSELEKLRPGGLVNNTQVIFSSENESNIIKAEPEKVFYISSADNYIKIYLAVASEIEPKWLRSSLKRTEADLKGHDQFYRCHRAYIVNLQKVDSVRGNARGLKLSLKNCLEEVPVSRALIEETREKIKKLHSS